MQEEQFDINNPRHIFNMKVSEFLRENEGFIFVQPIFVAMDELEDSSDIHMKLETVDLTAAALTHCYINYMKMLDPESFHHLTVDLIEEHFKIDNEKLTNESQKLHEKLEELDFNFTRTFAWENEYLHNFISNGQTQYLTFELKFKANKSLKDKLSKELDDANLHVEGEDKFLEIKQIDDHLFIKYRCKEDDMEEFLALSPTLAAQQYIVTIVESDVNLYLPITHYIHSIENHHSMGLGSMNFESEDDLRKHMDGMIGKKLEEVNPEEVPIVKALKMYELPKEEAIREVILLLKDNPEEIEALLFQAGWESNSEKRLEMVEHAVSIGEKQLESGKLKGHGPWWYDVGTRPYMRALSIYAQELRWLNYHEDADEIMWDILDKNETDNLGVRYEFLQSLIAERKWSECLEIRRRFPDDGHPLFYLADFLSCYFKYGKKSKTKKTLNRLMDNHPQVIEMALGIEPEEDGYFPFEVNDLVTDLLLYHFGRSRDLQKFFIRTLSEYTSFNEMLEKGRAEHGFSEN